MIGRGVRIGGVVRCRRIDLRHWTRHQLHSSRRHLEQSPRCSRRARCDRSTEGVSSHPPLRAAGQRRLQGQHRARQAFRYEVRPNKEPAEDETGVL
jgi:hypothetical protein